MSVSPPRTPRNDLDTGSTSGFSTPPRLASPRRDLVHPSVRRWLLSISFFANSGSLDDLSRIKELAKRIPDDIDGFVKEELDWIVKGGLNCAKLVDALAKEMLLLGLRQDIPDNQVRSRTPSDLR